MGILESIKLHYMISYTDHTILIKNKLTGDQRYNFEVSA